MNLRLLAGVVLAGASALAEPPTQDAPIADVLKELRRIESAAWRGKVDEARIELQTLAKSRPGDPMVRVYIAWCSMPTDDAWNQLKNISQMFPDLTWVHYGMGRIYVGWKMRDPAKTSLELALKKDPKFYPALVALGDLARVKDELDEAAAKYQQALALADDAEAHAGLGLVYAKQGKAAEARTELTKAITQWPDQPGALRELVKLEQAEKTPALAEHLSMLADLQPKDREARRMVASFKWDSGDRAGALVEYERLLKLGNPELEVATRLFELYRGKKDLEGEERAAALIAKIDKQAVPPLIRIAELKEARQDLDGAENSLFEALERDRDAADTWHRLGQLALAKKQPIVALERFRNGRGKTTPKAPDCDAEAKKLEESFKLPAKPAKGSVDRIYGMVAKTLEEFYTTRKRASPQLKGLLKVRVKVTAEGVVESSEVVEDTLGDPLLAGHAVFALRDAEFEKKRREPVFEFELGPVKKGK
ncbi:MAG: tetratricopeptide repeat protein [Myxococcaceae bacterium]|nr:tetratricopeptide repeat protein [Myxococcaceae bacterium]